MNIYEATIKERLEYYIEMIDKEIKENQTIINKNDHQSSIYQYFVDRLTVIKKDFETTRKVISNY